jgi:ubiquinone biosynthesis protein COQ4
MEAIAFTAKHHEEVLKLSTFERWRRGMKALLVVAQDPNRTDKVLEAYEHMNAGGEQKRSDRFYADPKAEQYRAEDRTIDAAHLDLAKLEQLPEGTFGNRYATFMKKRHLSPELFKVEGPLSNVEYMVKRMRQTHDLWHVATGYETDVLGELELQAFTLAQVGIPSALVVLMLGMVRWLLTGPELLFKITRAYFRGRSAKKMASFDWEAHWSAPLSEVRRELKVHDGVPRLDSAK